MNSTTYSMLKTEQSYPDIDNLCNIYPKSRVKIVPIECVFKNGVDYDE